MMITFHIDREQNHLVASAVGDLSRECLSGHWSAVEEAPEFGEFDGLYDFREVRTVTISTGVLRNLVDRLPHRPSERRIAVVAEANAVFGMSRMFQTLSEEKLPNLRVFRDIDEARGYLRPT